MFDNNTVKIERSDGGRLNVYAPYHPDLPKKFRSLGGKWSDGKKVWSFDIRDEQRVKAATEAVFGPAELSGQVVTLRYRLVGRYVGNPLRLAGRVIAERWGRDSEVRLSAGIVVVEGEFRGSAGSAKYPDLMNSNHADVVVEIRDVDTGIAAKMIEEGAEIVKD